MGARGRELVGRELVDLVDLVDGVDDVDARMAMGWRTAESGNADGDGMADCREWGRG